MMNNFIKLTLIVLTINTSMAATDQRWFSEDQIVSGQQLFLNNCASCHGNNAEGTLRWKVRDKNGFLPPPPLNGTAHTWHHDKNVLIAIIKQGGARYDGKMPPFEKVLNDAQIDNIIAFVQSTWSKEIYDRWASNYLNPQPQGLPSFDDLKNARKNQIKKLDSLK